MALEQFSVTWDNFHRNMSLGLSSLLENEDLVDVTLAVEGRCLKAHKMVLSVCSSYFNELFKTTPCKHPIVFMKDVSFIAMSDLLQFMYKGEVQVSDENFNEFIKTAEALQIRGLSNYGNGSLESGESPNNTKKTTESKVANLVTNETAPTPTLNLSDLNDHTAPELLKSEETRMEAPMATSSFSSEDFISFKTEPCDEEQSSVEIADDKVTENFFDDPLEDTSCVDEDDDYWMMEVGDTKSETLPEEELMASDIEEAAASGVPEKSKRKYEQVLEYFEQWCRNNNVKDIDENVLIKYFQEKAKKHKPSSLMSYYSILRNMLSIKRNININKYRNLLTFVKKVSKGHQTKKGTGVFQREDFEKFLKEAKDDKFLMMKVALIIGVTGACTCYELTYLHVENVIDEGNFIRIQLPDLDKKISREFLLMPGNIANINLLEIVRKYIQLRPTTYHRRFFVSFRHGKCTKQPVGVNTFGSMPKIIAKFLGLPNPAAYTGHCFKKTSLIIRLAPQQSCFL